MEWVSCRGRIPGTPGPDADRTVDVLDTDVAAVPEANVNPVADAFVDDGGDADAAGFGKRLQARRNVDAIAIDVIALDNDVAQIDADSKHDRRPWHLRRRHARTLHRKRAIDGIDHAAELCERTVAYRPL